jgi:hypothetical protein
MRIDDLRTQLSTLADDLVDAGPGTTTHGDRLAGVDQKVRDTRRTKGLVAVAAATVAVAAVAVAPSVVDGERSLEPTTPTESTTSGGEGLLAGIPKVPTVDADGIEVPTSYRGARLLAHAASEPGAAALPLEFVPSTRRILIGDLCAAAAQPGGDRLVYEMALNGEGVGASECDPPGTSTLMSVGTFSGPALEVHPGETNTIRIRTTDDFNGTATAVADARLALAVYERPAGDVVEVDGRVFDRYVDHAGRRFELVRARAADVAGGGAEVTVDLDGIDGVVLLAHGLTSSERRDNVDVEQHLLGPAGGVGLAPLSGGVGYRVWKVDRDQITFATTGWGDHQGWASLAVYMPVEPASGEPAAGE